VACGGGWQERFMSKPDALDRLILINVVLKLLLVETQLAQRIVKKFAPRRNPYVIPVAFNDMATLAIPLGQLGLDLGSRGRSNYPKGPCASLDISTRQAATRLAG
jgi:hypothetical protein